MAEPLKNSFGIDVAHAIARMVVAVYPRVPGAGLPARR